MRRTNINRKIFPGKSNLEKYILGKYFRGKLFKGK